MFSSTLSSIYNNNFPLIRASKKYVKNKSWITSGLKNSIFTKHKLYKKWIKSGLKADEDAFKLHSKLLKKLLRSAERNFYSNALDARVNSISKFGKL